MDKDNTLLSHMTDALGRGKGTWEIGLLKGLPTLVVCSPTALKVKGGVVICLGLDDASREELELLRDAALELLEQKGNGAH